MREGDRGALHLWRELRTTRLLHMIHSAHGGEPCPSYCMSNHLSRQRDIFDPPYAYRLRWNKNLSTLLVLHGKSSYSYINSWISSIQTASMSTHSFLLLNAWSCSDYTTNTVTVKYKPVRPVNEWCWIYTASIKATYHPSNLSIIYTSLRIPKSAWSLCTTHSTCKLLNGSSEDNR